MPSLSVLKTVLREVATTEKSARACEPQLIMDDSQQVAAYNEAGRENGVMLQSTFFTVQISAKY